MSDKLVVSGFEAFGRHAINPTAVALRELASDPRLAARVQFVVLPVTYRGAASVLSARVTRSSVRGCLAFGVSQDVARVRVERSAYNIKKAAIADNAGVICDGEVISHDAPSSLTSTGPLIAIRDALRANGALADLSDDPGRFVCNATYYALLAGERAGVHANSVFIHVPLTEEVGGNVSASDLARWMRVAIETYLTALGESSAAGLTPASSAGESISEPRRDS